MALAPNLATGRFDSVLSPGVETLHWGISIQYSTLYLTSRFDGGPPKAEPLNQWVPLVEFKFDSPRGQVTAATGFRAQLLFFLDDLAPSLFGKPLLTNQPERSQIAW
jgi:hypothetical protein